MKVEINDETNELKENPLKTYFVALEKLSIRKPQT